MNPVRNSPPKRPFGRASAGAISNEMKAARQIFFSWLPLAGATSGILLVCYAGIQQNYRQSLNDPQIQMAEDAQAALAYWNRSWESIIPQNNPVCLGNLDPWIAVIDTHGNVLADYDNSGKTSAVHITARSSDFGGDFGCKGGISMHLAIPEGALQAAATNRGKDTRQPNENRVTWQTSVGYEREAVVIVAINQGVYQGDFVVAGRNMREVENRIANLGTMFFLGWFVLMVATLFAKVVERYFV